jgi:large subunit ribosomal protein L11
MGKEKIESLVPGGKATAAPPLGPALGPLKVNIAEVVKAINEKTKGFDGMQVPVKVIVDTDTKKFEIEVGTPPASELILKEAKVEKGAGNPKMDKIADLRIEQIIKISKMKESSLLGKNLKARVKEIIGTCNSMGILVEGVPAAEAIGQVNDGVFDEEIKAEKTELSVEELKELEEEKKKLEQEAKARKAELEAKAKEIVTSMAGKEASAIKRALTEAKIPTSIIDVMMAEVTAAAAPAAAGSEKKEAKPAGKPESKA